MDVVDEDILDELEDVPKVKVSRLPEAAAREPAPEIVDRDAAGVRVVDNNVLCVHSYLITVLCLRLMQPPTPAARP